MWKENNSLLSCPLSTCWVVVSLVRAFSFLATRLPRTASMPGFCLAYFQDWGRKYSGTFLHLCLVPLHHGPLSSQQAGLLKEPFCFYLLSLCLLVHLRDGKKQISMGLGSGVVGRVIGIARGFVLWFLVFFSRLPTGTAFESPQQLLCTHSRVVLPNLSVAILVEKIEWLFHRGHVRPLEKMYTLQFVTV